MLTVTSMCDIFLWQQILQRKITSRQTFITLSVRLSPFIFRLSDKPEIETEQEENEVDAPAHETHVRRLNEAGSVEWHGEATW